MYKKSVYRAYLLHPGQRVTDITTTECPNVADFALDRLERANFGADAHAVLSKDGKQIAYCSSNYFTENQKSAISACVEKLKNIQLKTSDTELAHVEADKALCEILNNLGLNSIVKEYEKIDKWYA